MSYIHYFKANELNKNMNSINKILEILLNKNFSRDDCLISIGGGITGDISGFAASLFKRGLKFINIPTTLLSQVDSSIGGKTGVNTKYGKNLVGSFYQPNLVISDTEFLKTLPKREIVCGYGEILKHSIIGNKKFYNFLNNHKNKILKLTSPFLEKAIHESCKIKKAVVQKDEKEKGLRKILNFGHTFGHALEKHFTKNEVLLHGEAVSIGMAYASKFSTNIGVLKKDECDEIINLISDIGLPISINDIKGEITKEEILNLMMFDKKRVNQKNTLILLNRIGEAFINNNISDKEIIDFFNMENIQ